MPIVGPSSYLPTTEEFLAHWASANAAMPDGQEVIVGAGTTRAVLDGFYEELEPLPRAIQRALNARELARGEIDLAKRELLERFQQFAGLARARLVGRAELAMLPRAPQFSDGSARFLEPMEDVADMWNRVNTRVFPIVLAGDYRLFMFNQKVGELETAYGTYRKAENDLKVERARRNALQERIYPILKQYREAIPGYFGADSAMAASLPRLTPKPGSTPDPVTIEGRWDADAGVAVITYTASDNPALDRYQLRVSPGPTYNAEDESAIANNDPETDPREFRTTESLETPGAVATFKVYVMLDTGNEAGSESVTVVRAE
ncbi:MAG: hypothetical protein ACFB21_12860 [Opitutales bacterium]